MHIHIVKHLKQSNHIFFQSNEKIAIIFHDKPSGTVQVKLEGGEYIDCRRQNDQTYTFKAPCKHTSVIWRFLFIKIIVFVSALNVVLGYNFQCTTSG